MFGKFPTSIIYSKLSTKCVTIIVILSCINLTTAQQQPDNNQFLCDEIFCLAEDGETCPVPRNCSTQKYREYLTPQICNCCPGTFCMEYIKENDPCFLNPTPSIIDICGPHLTCSKKDGEGDATCVTKTDTKCLEEVKIYNDNFADGTIGTAQFLPDCTAGGDYALKQCLPGSVCFCTNSIGERIFGLGRPTTKMDCKCSRDIDMLTRVNQFKGSLPHCLPNGDYDELQCVERSCWCRQKPEVREPILRLNNLPCYDKNIHPLKPNPYLRNCDHARAENKYDQIKAENISVTLLVADEPRCDPDGYFAPVQSQNNLLICVDQKGRQIDNYQVDKKSQLALKMDCYCARVREIMEEGVNGLPICCKIGNFRSWQCTSSICYCVDKDGKQIVTPGLEPHEVPIDDVDKLICKQASTDDDDCAY